MNSNCLKKCFDVTDGQFLIMISALEVLSNHVSHIVSVIWDKLDTLHIPDIPSIFPRPIFSPMIHFVGQLKHTKAVDVLCAPSSWFPMQSCKGRWTNRRRSAMVLVTVEELALDAAAPALEGGDGTAWLLLGYTESVPYVYMSCIYIRGLYYITPETLGA